MKTLPVVLVPFVAAFAAIATPIVQVRDIPNAPAIAVVGWDPTTAEYGIRTRLRRDGSHLGDGRGGEHRLYVNTSFSDANGGFVHAVAHTGKLLRSSGAARDLDACKFGNACSPGQTVGIGVADELLRENRDSLVVTFRPKTGRTWSIRLDRSLIDAYLATIDSVATTLKK